MITGSVALLLTQKSYASVQVMLSCVIQYLVLLQPVMRERPSGQAEHDAAPTAEYAPSLQSVHGVVPPGLIVPPAQHVQVVVPFFVVKDPGSHRTQGELRPGKEL